jgi:sugar phosphate isomerase/epimerase
MSSRIDFAVSLYGFTERWINDPEYGLEDMFRELNRLGIRKFEIVGSQVFDQYPLPKRAEIDNVLSLAGEYGVEPFSYGGYVDIGKFSDHDMTDQEIINEVSYDLLTAHRLGCKYLRGGSVPDHLIPQVAMLAELYDIKVAFEVHAPSKPSDPDIQATLQAIKDCGTSHVGFVPDLGCFITKPNPLMIERYVDLGARRELLDFIVANRHSGYTEESIRGKVQSMGAGEAERYAISELFGFLSFAESADLEGFRSILPWSFYFHGKFYHIGEDCIETTIPYDQLMAAIVDSGFKGVMMTEYEGHCFYLNDAVEQIGRHLQMQRNILGRLGC